MKKIVASTIVLVLVYSTYVVSLRSQTASSSNSSNGTITGKVMQHGKGLAGVTVKAWRQPLAQPPKDALEARTDLEGFYRITSVSPANYYVAAYRAGLVPAQDGGLSVSPKAVSISAAEAESGIDFELVGGGVITGRVTNGNGQPLSGEPVILVEVKPQPNPTLSFPNPLMMPFTSGFFKTDDRGIYRVYGIPPGTYKVSVGTHFPAFTAFRGEPSYRRTFYPGTNDESKARVLEVAESAVVSNIDINVGSLVPTFSASGRIIDNATGQPVPAVRYDIHISGATGGGQIPNAGASNEVGEFKLNNLPAGRYSVRISETTASKASASEFFGESKWFDIGDSDVSGVEVRASRTSGAAGVVMIENTNDKTIRARAAQLNLLFQTLPKGGGRPGLTAAKPESDLSFSIRGLQPGQLRVRLNSEEQAVAVGLRFLRMELPDSTPIREVEIKEGQQFEGLRVVLVYGSGSVRGFVKLENGALPAEGKVHARITNEKGFYAGLWIDSRGGFLIESVPAGNYTLIVSAEVPGKRTLRAEARQPIAVSEGSVAQTSIVLDLGNLSGP